MHFSASLESVLRDIAERVISGERDIEVDLSWYDHEIVHAVSDKVAEVMNQEAPPGKFLAGRLDTYMSRKRGPAAYIVYRRIGSDPFYFILAPREKGFTADARNQM